MKFLLICVVIGILCSTAFSFDIFNLFGRHRDGAGHREQQARSREGRCAGYLCTFSEGPCVDDPRNCPCRDAQYRCEHGPSEAYSCVSGRGECDLLRRAIELS